MSEKKSLKHKGSGHRKRLRERFMQSGFDGFLDYEIVELLLTLGTPMKDCKQMAKEVIKKYKGLKGALDASVDNLQQIKGIGPSNAFGLKLFQSIAERYAKENIPKKISLDSTQAIINYLQEKIGKERKEHFIALYLDSRNQLIHEEIISVGTLNANLVHPREVYKPAIDNSALSILVAHNHPSGKIDPSEADINFTTRLKEVGKIIGIDLLDHYIITNNNFKRIII